MPQEQRTRDILLVHYAEPCAFGYAGSTRHPDQVLGRLKEFTSKQLTAMISKNPKESRKEWLMNMFEQAGKLSSNVKSLQFWQHHNKPIGVWSPEVIQQKVDYIHNNPVVAGFVFEPHHWKYSSAIDYSGGKGLLEMDFI